MSRKFWVTIEIEMPDDQTTSDAAGWGASVLETAFTKSNPAPKPSMYSLDRAFWHAQVPMPAAEHPYRPRVVRAIEVAQPAPRTPER